MTDKALGMLKRLNRRRAEGGEVMSDGDLRMLGAIDGLAHATILVRAEIVRINSLPIPKHHRRRIALRKERLCPLLNLEKRLLNSLEDTKMAYERTLPPKGSHHD